MASSLSPLSKSIAIIPTITNGSPKKSLCFNFKFQNLRSTICVRRVFFNCAVSMRRKHFRRNRVAGLKICSEFRRFVKIFYVEMEMKIQNLKILEGLDKLSLKKNTEDNNGQFWRSCLLPFVISSWLSSCQVAQSSVGYKKDMVYEIGELFELGIQLSYLLILLGLLGLGTFFVIRQVLVRRELDLSAKELQEQVRSGDATATEYFELGAVMLRRKLYPVATKYLQQAIEKWDRDDQDLAQVHNALGVSYVRDKKIDEGIAQFETAVKLQPGYVTAWNNMGDAYEKKKNLKLALTAFEQVLLFDPNNKIARPRRDALRDRVQLYKGVPLKSEER